MDGIAPIIGFVGVEPSCRIKPDCAVPCDVSSIQLPLNNGLVVTTKGATERTAQDTRYESEIEEVEIGEGTDFG